jgi:hypothetical protein
MIDVNTVSLPKWPQMRVWGRPVTQRQAQAIIARTDSFWSNQGRSGNNDLFENDLCRALSIPRLDYGAANADWQAMYEAWEQFQTKIGYISTEYVYNSWISCTFIGGPHGWCHPDGRIFYEDNVGKWPSAGDVMEDWVKLAEAFPFLELEAALMTGESCEDHTSVAVVFNVSKGAVTAHGANYPLFERFDVEQQEVVSTDRVGDMVAALTERFSGRGRGENYFTVAQVCAMVKALEQA